jgi:hypothetical protein
LKVGKTMLKNGKTKRENRKRKSSAKMLGGIAEPKKGRNGVVPVLPL